MASFQEGNDPHVIFIETNNTGNMTFTYLTEAQPSSQVAGSWQLSGVIDQQARQPSSICLLMVSSGIKVFFVGNDVRSD